jgi:hypothetical protein
VPPGGKSRQLRELIAARGWRRIGEAEWSEIFTEIPDISVLVLQRLEIPVDPPWCGVRQHTLEELEASLLALSEVYAIRPDLRSFCRDRVIVARALARHASRNRRTDEEKRNLKAEMAQWMLTWLGDPALFPVWARLRMDLLKRQWAQ